MVVVRIRQMVALCSASEHSLLWEQQGLQALVGRGRWSLDTSGRSGFTVLGYLP